MGASRYPTRDDPRADRVEQRLAIPVLVAALVSVPAIFLARLDGAAAIVGRVLNWASLGVLAGETLLLLLLSVNVGDWVRRHKWQLLILATAVPAVIFLVGPVQILRLLLSFRALHVLRARRIVRAGRVLRRWAGSGTRRGQVLIAAAVAVAVVFVAIVLADPTSRSRRIVGWIGTHIGFVPATLALVLLAVAILLARRHRVFRRIGNRLRRYLRDRT